MWNSQTEIIYRTDVGSIKKEHLENLMVLFSIPSKGILIVIDDDDYKDYPNPIWRNQGLHLNIRLGGIEEMSPEHLLDIMESGKYSNIIWFAKRICAGDLLSFVWVASHEFQHFLQDKTSHDLSVANTFLYSVLGDKKLQIDEPRVAMSIPAEFDAELSAFKTITNIFGATEAEKYIRQPDRFDRIGCLLKYDNNVQYDLIGQTIYLLEKYRDQLESYIKSAFDPMIKSFDVAMHIRDLQKLKK